MKRRMPSSAAGAPRGKLVCCSMRLESSLSSSRLVGMGDVLSLAREREEREDGSSCVESRRGAY
jgi:hypothetical protein